MSIVNFIQAQPASNADDGYSLVLELRIPSRAAMDLPANHGIFWPELYSAYQQTDSQHIRPMTAKEMMPVFFSSLAQMLDKNPHLLQTPCTAAPFDISSSSPGMLSQEQQRLQQPQPSFSAAGQSASLLDLDHDLTSSMKTLSVSDVPSVNTSNHSYSSPFFGAGGKSVHPFTERPYPSLPSPSHQGSPQQVLSSPYSKYSRGQPMPSTFYHRNQQQHQPQDFKSLGVPGAFPPSLASEHSPLNTTINTNPFRHQTIPSEISHTPTPKSVLSPTAYMTPPTDQATGLSFRHLQPPKLPLFTPQAWESTSGGHLPQGHAGRAEVVWSQQTTVHTPYAGRRKLGTRLKSSEANTDLSLPGEHGNSGT